MKKSKKQIIILIVLLFAVFSVYEVAKLSSYRFALRLNGFDSPVTYVNGTYIAGKEEFRLTVNRNPDNLKIGHFQKNRWGFWEKSFVSSEYDIKEGVLYYSFPEHYVNSRWYRSGDLNNGIPTESLYHYLFTGNNARQLIDIPRERIPNNVTIDIEQSGNFYIIHALMYTYDRKADALIDPNEVIRLLLDLNLIE